MSADIIQLNPEAFQTELKGLVKSSIEETLNAMLDEEAKKLVKNTVPCICLWLFMWEEGSPNGFSGFCNDAVTEYHIYY